LVDLNEDLVETSLNPDQLWLLELGKNDRETEVEVSVTVHITESFRYIRRPTIPGFSCECYLTKHAVCDGYRLH